MKAISANYTETGEDRIQRANEQMRALLLMLGIYYDNAEEGTTDTLAESTLRSYVSQLEQNLDDIEMGLQEMERQGSIS